MSAMIWKRWWRPGTGALLLSLLFVAHVFCAAGAVAAASTPEAHGTAATAAASATATATTVAAPASADAGSPHSGSHAEEHHLCPSDASASADHRTTALPQAALLGLGTGTAPLRAPTARAVPWQPSTTAAVPWSGTRLLFSLCVLRV